MDLLLVGAGVVLWLTVCAMAVALCLSAREGDRRPADLVSRLADRSAGAQVTVAPLADRRRRAASGAEALRR